MHIGERILQVAKAQGFTQARLAEKLGINQASVSVWGKGGTPKMEKISEIAKILGVSEQYLVFGNNENAPEIDKYYSQALLRLRYKTKWSVAKLAEELDLSVNTVVAIERGARLASKTVSLRIDALLKQYDITEDQINDPTDQLKFSEEVYDVNGKKGTTIVRTHGIETKESTEVAGKPEEKIQRLTTDLAESRKLVSILIERNEKLSERNEELSKRNEELSSKLISLLEKRG